MADFKVGDRVKIRSWESMEKEFGSYEGSIRCCASFTKLMKPLCGRYAKILSIDGYFVGLDFEDKTGDTKWQYSVDMIEKIDPLPRICYVLGGEDTPLEIGEEFEIDIPELRKTVYRIVPDGQREFSSKSGERVWIACGAEGYLLDIINHPEKIIRKPRLTFYDDEKALMRLYVGAGYPWFARDKDKYVFACKNKPNKRTSDFSDGTGDYCTFPNPLLPQITWENSPFNAAEYLEDLKND